MFSRLNYKLTLYEIIYFNSYSCLFFLFIICEVLESELLLEIFVLVNPESVIGKSMSVDLTGLREPNQSALC